MSVLALASSVALGWPQQVTPPQESSVLEDIQVVGRESDATLEARVDRFVDQISAPAGDYGPARWHRDVCVGAINFQPVAARAIVDRISEVALQLGLDPEDPGCEPQVLIIATNDGPGTAAGLVEREPRLFILGGDGMDLGRAALNRFQSSEQPVRWWHISLPVDADTGQRAVRLPGDNPDTPIIIQKFAASRLRSATRDNLQRAIIIVDTARLGDATFSQLADYVALLAMAQVNPAVDVRGQDSILNLFDNPSSVSGLTAWDMAYLHGLYEAELDAVSQNSRFGAVERGMAERQRNPAGE
ncbi:MAG: hypothetical protein V4701_08265 [Pseudomonadota bacterium]